MCAEPASVDDEMLLYAARRGGAEVADAAVGDHETLRPHSHRAA